MPCLPTHPSWGFVLKSGYRIHVALTCCLGPMFSYLVGFVAIFAVLYNPLSQFFSPGIPQVRRTPRPQINTDLLALEENTGNETGTQCPQDAYSVHIFSREPLVIYIEGFLLPEERVHLLDIRCVWPRKGYECMPENALTQPIYSEPLFTPSTVTDDGGASTHRDSSVRDSEVALVPRTAAVRCVESRARALQGWRDEVWVERLRVQRYRPGGHYAHHFDWSSSRGGWGRVSSFMAWVDDSAGSAGEGELVGGGTEFPLLRSPEDRRWCRFVECAPDNGTSAESSEPSGSERGDLREGLGGATGVVFKPLVGNAVYWENFRSDGSGRGYEETWHAGLPVVEGVKVGLNIWSWGRID